MAQLNLVADRRAVGEKVCGGKIRSLTDTKCVKSDLKQLAKASEMSLYSIINLSFILIRMEDILRIKNMNIFPQLLRLIFKSPIDGLLTHLSVEINCNVKRSENVKGRIMCIRFIFMKLRDTKTMRVKPNFETSCVLNIPVPQIMENTS